MPAPVLEPALGEEFVGMRAKIIGLTSKPELNETVGIVQSYVEERGRWAVLLPSGEVVAIKPTNLRWVGKH